MEEGRGRYREGEGGMENEQLAYVFLYALKYCDFVKKSKIRVEDQKSKIRVKYRM